MLEPSEMLVEQAQRGDRAAQGELLVAIQDRVYGLALRMLGDPAEAQDAVQDILLRIVRHLDRFRGEAAFTTWVYRIAVNQILTARTQRAQRPRAMAELAEWLDAGLARGQPAAPDPVLVEESKLICTQAMLQGLDPDLRVAYILGEILELTSEEGAAVVETSSDTFRKRLQRARERLAELTQGRCGLVATSHPCRCDRQIDNGIASGMIDPARLRYAHHPVRERARAIEEVKSLASVLRNQPEFAAPKELAAAIRAALAERALDRDE
jgi:RNA polymerase sigma factor (sigma-70 family)